jgi:hypothetical protein
VKGSRSRFRSVNPYKLQQLGQFQTSCAAAATWGAEEISRNLSIPLIPVRQKHEESTVQQNGIFKDRFVTPNVGCCFGVLDRQQSDLAGALARAVCDEPNFKYMIPDKRGRVRFLTVFFGFAGRAGQLRGEVLTGQDGNSAAVWMRCDGAFSLARVVRMAIRQTPRQWSWPDLKRCLTVTEQFDRVHRQLVRGPHWYLLATGIEKSVIEPIRLQFHADLLPYYIETFNEKYLSLWKRHGFRIVGGGTISRDGPDFWAMMRDGPGISTFREGSPQFDDNSILGNRRE